jgi:hypothetical protein
VARPDRNGRLPEQDGEAGKMSEALSLAGNPKSVLNGKRNVQMGEPYVAVPGAWRSTPAANQIQFDGTKCFDVGWMGAPVAKVTVAPSPGTSRSPTRFLPFQEDKVTCMMVDPGASAVFTSQLTGCNIYVSTIGGDVWLFHANANGTVGDNNANNRAKRTLAEAARSRLGGTSWDLSLERGVQPFYPAGSAAGIFFGQKVVAVGGGSGWGFYLYTVDGIVHRLASSIAGTNATV